MSLRLEQLKKRYVGPDGSAVPVIDIDNFELADGEQVALIGGSGTGKTTLLHLIAGILAPDSGRILFAEQAAPAAPSPPQQQGPAGEPAVLNYRAAGTAVAVAQEMWTDLG